MFLDLRDAEDFISGNELMLKPNDMRAFNLIAEKQFDREGFQITFENGCTISVMFGKGTYSDKGQTTAEVAAWNKNGNWMVWSQETWITLEDYKTEVMSHITPNELSLMMTSLSEQKRAKKEGFLKNIFRILKYKFRK